jgi:hypothetical protein
MVFITIQHQGLMQPVSWSRTIDFFKEQLNKKEYGVRNFTVRRYRIMDDVVVMSSH